MPPLQARVTLFVDRAVGKVNRWVFGNNMLGYQKGGWPYAEPIYEDGVPPVEELFALAFACPDQIQSYYDDLRRLLRETTGRDNVPIAVTEFNGHFVQEKPVPYRHTLGNALLNAEMLRVFLNKR